MIILTLPWPPTVNSYWRSIVVKGRSRVLISKKGRQYRKAVADAVMVQRGAKHLDGPLRVLIEATPPDNRRRDLDNLLKGTLDALEKAGVYEDDGQIDSLTVFRLPKRKPGHLVVKIGVLDRDDKAHATRA